MKSILRVLSQHQLPNGQFPTTVINYKEGFKRNVHTITSTYLICLMLSMLRERCSSHPLIDKIFERGMFFLQSIAYWDPVEKIKVWHFNAYYAPDWEETCWCSYLLYQSGMIQRSDLESLFRLAITNETPDKGVGVWVRDDYSKDNKFKNVFDPVVSLGVAQWLWRIFGYISESTEEFIQSCWNQGSSSLYYDETFRDFFFSLFGYGERPASLSHRDYRLFHHGNRTQVWYASSDVWETASLLLA